MNVEIQREATQRGITRLCHFSPSRNLIHIAVGKVGILSTKNLTQSERGVFTPTDLQRLDSYTGHICCSIQYPNAWYLDKARAQDALFPDWVVLLLGPRFLWLPGTRFCPRNAASGFGRGIKEGTLAFREMFADSVLGARGRTYRRSVKHLDNVPTDEQAEVLVPDRVPQEDILGVAVQSAAQARNEAVRFRLAGIPSNTLKIVVAPTLFDKQALSNCIRNGTLPDEKAWNPGVRR